MIDDCVPVSALPGITKLFSDFLAMREGQAQASPQASDRRLDPWFGAVGASGVGEPHAALSPEHRDQLAAILFAQAKRFGASAAVNENIRLLQKGARAVVTGQQVGLFGGPLLTLFKAATAIARAQQATTRTGVPHVPVFWLASEDHDFAEADTATVVSRRGLETMHLGDRSGGVAQPVGRVVVGEAVDGLLDRMDELLGPSPMCDLLRASYGRQADGAARPTFAGAFGRWMTQLFAAYGLIVLDPQSREVHALGASTLRFAIERAAELEAALLARDTELVAAGYHAQVLVKEGGSLLFLLADVAGREGLWERLPLRRIGSTWRAGPHSFDSDGLLALLEAEPERLSPNALLRPVFQDTILPTAAYIGGPAEIAYFAQSAVLYEQIFSDAAGQGRPTAVLSRLSATVIEPETAHLMARFELSLSDLFSSEDEASLAQRLGARALPILAKRRLAAAGGALDSELTVLTEYLSTLDAGLGRTAAVAASKMRYQMNRLRRMAARYELARDERLGRQAESLMQHLFPHRHLQERLLSGSYFLARCGHSLIEHLVTSACDDCTVHRAIWL